MQTQSNTDSIPPGSIVKELCESLFSILPVVHIPEQISRDFLVNFIFEERDKNTETFFIYIISLLRYLPPQNPQEIKTRDVITRCMHHPSDMIRLLNLYNLSGQKKISKQLQQGLAQSFYKFSEEEFGEAKPNGTVSLRDVLFISHVKPRNELEARLFRKIARNQL